MADCAQKISDVKLSPSVSNQPPEPKVKQLYQVRQEDFLLPAQPPIF